MAVDLPSTDDVRKARHELASRGAEAARTPLLAVLGAGDIAVTAVTKAVNEARTRATVARSKAGEQAEDVQHRFTGLPQRLTAEELRKAAADLRAQAEQAYTGFAERGAGTWDRLREQPQVKEALARIESVTEKLDARVDVLVDDARDAAERALTVISTQTQTAGERVARVTQRFSEQTAETVAETGEQTAETVAETGERATEETRSAARGAASRTAPKTAEKTAAQKTAARRSGTRRSTSENAAENGSEPTS